MYNDFLGKKPSEELEKQTKVYCSTQYENCLASLLNCFIPLITQCINPNCSKNNLSNPILHHDITVFCSGGSLKKGTVFLKDAPNAVIDTFTIIIFDLTDKRC